MREAARFTSREGEVTLMVAAEKEWVKEGETLELRYWSGRPYDAG